MIATLLCDVLHNKWQSCNICLFFGGATLYFIKDLDLSMLVNDAVNYWDCVVLAISKWIVWSMGGMILTGENWSTRENTVQVPLCPPQIPHGLPGIKSGLMLWEAMTVCLSHGMAWHDMRSIKHLLYVNAIHIAPDLHRPYSSWVMTVQLLYLQAWGILLAYLGQGFNLCPLVYEMWMQTTVFKCLEKVTF